MEALYHCAKIAKSLQRNIRPLFALGLLCFYSSLNVLYLTAATKNIFWEQITPSSLNQDVFY